MGSSRWTWRLLALPGVAWLSVFFLDEKNAYNNFVNFNGYIPPQNGIDADTLLKQGLIPKSLEQAVVRPDQFAANQELLQLSVAGQRFWDDAWSKFKAG